MTQIQEVISLSGVWAYCQWHETPFHHMKTDELASVPEDAQSDGSAGELLAKTVQNIRDLVAEMIEYFSRPSIRGTSESTRIVSTLGKPCL